jgi:chemotaxis protein CheD
VDRTINTVQEAVAGRAPGSWLASDRITPQTGPPDVYLHPGQHHIATSPVILKMILGSCVGVFFFDRILAIGGATHFMLPHQRTGLPSPRYGDVAIKQLLEEFRGLGSRHLEAKIFGGASMLIALRGLQGSHIGQIGQKNAETALEILAKERIVITEKNLLDERCRKVSMVSNTGATTLEFVGNADGNR